jgi:group I intron endonuclease
MKTKEKNSWTLYRHISPNNKIYVGITSQKPENRWNNGKGYFNVVKSKFKSAIIKYGWDNFKHEIILENLDECTAKELEIALIKYYKKLNISLNTTDGGDGVLGFTPWNKGLKLPYEKTNKRKKIPLTEEHKRKLSEAHKGKSYGKGRKLSPEQIEKIRQANLGRIKPLWEREKIRKNSTLSKKIIELDSNGNVIHNFLSLSEASRFYNLDPSWVAKACRNKTLCSGHIFVYDSADIDFKSLKIKKKKRSYIYYFE